MKNYHVKFNFTFDEEHPVLYEFDVEAENFVDAQFTAMNQVSECIEFSSISEVVE